MHENIHEPKNRGGMSSVNKKRKKSIPRGKQAGALTKFIGRPKIKYERRENNDRDEGAAVGGETGATRREEDDDNKLVH